MDKIKEALWEMAVVISAVVFLGLLVLMSADLASALVAGGESGAGNSGVEALGTVQVPRFPVGTGS